MLEIKVESVDFYYLSTLVEQVEPEVNEEPFVAPPGLAIPPDVELVSNNGGKTSISSLFHCFQLCSLAM